jgi:hypothetical protein
MKPGRKFQLTLGRSNKGVPRPPRAGRPVPKATRVKLPVKAAAVARSLRATPGAAPIVKRVPNLAAPQFWAPVASFAVCGKTGTAAYLDIWDSDHFDFVTDMQSCLSRCLAWFSADGYTFWVRLKQRPAASIASSSHRRTAPMFATHSCRAMAVPQWSSA